MEIDHFKKGQNLESEITQFFFPFPFSDQTNNHSSEIGSTHLAKSRKDYNFGTEKIEICRWQMAQNSQKEHFFLILNFFEGEFLKRMKLNM